jgi:hypothetical protein
MPRLPRFGFPALALSALVALGTAGPTAAQQGVPFKATLAGTIVESMGNTFVADDTGEATHLGAFTAVQTYVFSSGTDFTGSVVFEAANGDVLRGTFEGVDSPTGDLVGNFTLDGGTWRFTHATGKGTFAGVDHQDGTFDAELDGTISYKASDGKS